MAELGLKTTFENSWSITKADYNTMMYVSLKKMRAQRPKHPWFMYDTYFHRMGQNLKKDFEKNSIFCPL